MDKPLVLLVLKEASGQPVNLYILVSPVTYFPSNGSIHETYSPDAAEHRNLPYRY